MENAKEKPINKLRDLFENYFPAFEFKYPQYATHHVKQTIQKILSCRTVVLGCKLYGCVEHGFGRVIPFSCGNRFCVSCANARGQAWLDEAVAVLTSIDTSYHFITITVPGSISQIIKFNKKLLLSEFFSSASGSLIYWSRKRGFLPGFVMVMQTSGDRLNFHVHIHLLITSGGLFFNRWIKNLHYPPDAILKSFKTLIFRALRRAYLNQDFVSPPEYADNACSSKEDFNKFLGKLWEINWNLHIAKDLKKAKDILGYIARYLKKPPISNSRIIEYDDSKIVFMARDYEKKKRLPYIMSLGYFFISLFEHVPIAHFPMVRWYGLFSNRNKKKYIELLQGLIPSKELKEKLDPRPLWRIKYEQKHGIDPLACPVCKKEMELLFCFSARMIKELGFLSFEEILRAFCFIQSF